MAASSYAVLTRTVTATGVIAAARFATVAGLQAGAGANTLGVTRTAAAIGNKIPVDVLGTAIVEAGAAVAVGDTIAADASGRAIKWTTGAKIALALSAATAAGDMIEVLLIPNAA